MASHDKLLAVHTTNFSLGITGGFLCLIGSSVFFLSYEVSTDFNLQSQSQYKDSTALKSLLHSRKHSAKKLFYLSIFLYLTGLALVLTSMVLYEDEREHLPTDIPTLVDQLREQQSKPDTNELAILSGVSICVILLGSFLVANDWRKYNSIQIKSTLPYILGWIIAGVTASLTTRSASSIKTDRLAWVLPGVFGILLGTLILPKQMQHGYTNGPGFIIASIGYILFGFGNALILER